MGRIGITYEDVKKTIAELQGKQKKPTVDNIRAVLGTGSKSTIARFLKAWRSQHGLIDGEDGSIPSELLSMIRGLWESLQTKADNQAIEYKRAADTKLLEMEQQLTQSTQRQTELESKIHGLEEQYHQQIDDNKQLKQTLSTEQQDKARIAGRAASLETRRQESIAENERLHQLLKHMQENLVHYQSATQKLRQEQSLALDKQRNEYEQKILQLQTQLNTVTTEKTQGDAQYAQLNETHQTLKNDHKLLIQKNDKTQKEYDALNINHLKMQDDYERLSGEYQQQSKNLETKKNEVMELEIKLKVNDEKTASLKEALSNAEDKIQALRDDYQFASQEKANLAGQIKQLEVNLSKKRMATS